jgi:CRP/FNR family cyclic AMP-dependent transcriptional regulator
VSHPSAYEDAHGDLNTGADVDTDASTLANWVRSTGRIRRWSVDSPVIRQGEGGDLVVLIRTGHVKIVSLAPSGKQVVLALRGPGDLLGEFSALDGRPRSASVLALTDVQGWVVPAADFVAHLSVDPKASLALLRLVVSRLREADLRRLEFGSLDTISRIASLLCAMAEQHGSDPWIRLTQSELGESAAASREATVKAVARLRTAGLIETGRGRIRVIRAAELRLVAQGHACQ